MEEIKELKHSKDTDQMVESQTSEQQTSEQQTSEKIDIDQKIRDEVTKVFKEFKTVVDEERINDQKKMTDILVTLDNIGDILDNGINVLFYGCIICAVCLTCVVSLKRKI